MIKLEIPAWFSVLWLCKAYLTLNVKFGVSLSFKCTEGQRDFPQGREEGRGVPGQASARRHFLQYCLLTCPLCGCIRAQSSLWSAWNGLQQANVRLKLCRLSVSLTSIILTCFYSHILSPHFLFASNKIVFEAWCWKYRSPPENIITLSQQSARTSKSMGGNAELLLFFLVAHIKLFFFWMFECSLLTKQPKSPTTVYVILPGYFGFWRTLRWDYMRLRKVGFQWKQIYASLAETVLFSYCHHHIFKEKPSFYLFIYH